MTDRVDAAALTAALIAGIDALNLAVGDDPVFIAAAAAMFTDHAPGLLGTVRTAIAAGDDGGCIRAAHTLKSNFATLGLTDPAAVCARLERTAGHAPGAGEDIEYLDAAIGLVIAELARLTG